MKEARYYEKLDGSRVHCLLCPQDCRIADGKVGFCRVRKNEGGTLYSLIYGEVTSVALDPIEKKPLYHFHPGSDVLSIGTWGCNFRCPFCQNWTISQVQAETRSITSQELVRLARRESPLGIAYTYNEPFIWFEFVFDTAQAMRDAGMKNVLVTNGYVNEAPLRELLPLIDAMNIDLKSFRDEFYQKLCRGRIEHVLRTLEISRKATHIEVTNLVIPGHNDSENEFREMAAWVAERLGPDTPMHLSAHTPRYELKAPPTPPATLLKAREIFAAKLQHVYLGNVLTQNGTSTKCHSCGKVLIERSGYNTRVVGLKGEVCAGCGAENNIVV